MARLSKARFWLAAGVLTLVAFPMTWAFADEFVGSGTVTINNNGDTGNFYGSVSSDHGRCLGNRDVVLVRDRKKKPAKVVGSDTTNGNGNYTIHKKSPQGRYYIKLERRLDTEYGHRHDCKGDRSPLMRIKG